MSMNILAANIAAIAGAALLALQPGEPDGFLQSAADPESHADTACHIELAATPDGLLVTAWGEGEAGKQLPHGCHPAHRRWWFRYRPGGRCAAQR